MATSLREWLAEHPPPDSAFRQSLARVAERVRAGEELRFAVREFLDEFALLPRVDLRRAAIGRRPLPTGDARADAYLGALAEHRSGLPRARDRGVARGLSAPWDLHLSRRARAGLSHGP